MKTAERLGSFLVRGGVIDNSQLADGLQIHQVTGQPLTESLTALGYCQALDILPKLARQLGI